jgi:hypothetical protein
LRSQLAIVDRYVKYGCRRIFFFCFLLLINVLISSHGWYCFRAIGLVGHVQIPAHDTSSADDTSVGAHRTISGSLSGSLSLQKPFYLVLNFPSSWHFSCFASARFLRPSLDSQSFSVPFLRLSLPFCSI